MMHAPLLRKGQKDMNSILKNPREKSLDNKLIMAHLAWHAKEQKDKTETVEKQLQCTAMYT